MSWRARDDAEIGTLTRLLNALIESAGVLVLWIPGGVGSRLRIMYYRARGTRIGKDCRIEVGFMIDQPGLVEIGDRVWLDRYAILIAGKSRPGRETRRAGDPDEGLRGSIRIGSRCHIGASTIVSGIGGVSIGDDVTLAAGTKVYSLTHHYRSWKDPKDKRITFGSMGPDTHQSMLEGVVSIGHNVGVGADVLILPGVSLGEGSFVRPRSVVTESFGPNSIIAGDPAQRTGDRFPS
jgi:acetyltransferase-like isoleucine patch superfamily enzyme